MNTSSRARLLPASSVLFLFLLLLSAALSGPVRAEEACLECHEDSFPESTLAVLRSLDSPHGGFDCTGCHTDASDDHPEDLKPVACRECHEEEDQVYLESVHGRRSREGDTLAASCADCHGTHDIRSGDDPESSIYPLNLPATCGACHNNEKMSRRHDIAVPDAYVEYLGSVHGKGLLKSGLLVSASCKDCHGDHEIQGTDDPRSKLNRQQTPATCGRCHTAIESTYRRSIHGRLWTEGNSEVPTCTTCHASHTIKRPDSAGFQLELIGGCGGCHQEQIETYRETYHGQVTALGFVAVAKCADCHGYHDVLPSSDPASKTHRGKIMETCSGCHPGASPNFASFETHGDHRDRERYPHLYYTYMFMTTLLTSVFILFGLHSGLWLVRALIEARSHVRQPEPDRED